MDELLGSDLAIQMLGWLTGTNVVLHSGTLRLFTNPTIVAPTTVLGDFVECSAPGYAGVPFAAMTWQLIPSVQEAYSAADPVQIAFSGPGSPGQTIYGHYITDSAGLNYWWGATWAAPYVIPSGGGAVNVAELIAFGPLLGGSLPAGPRMGLRSRQPL